jgi:hypothetical protein
MNLATELTKFYIIPHFGKGKVVYMPEQGTNEKKKHRGEWN